MLQQTTSTVLMVRPANFYLNQETAVNNVFQTNTTVDNLNQKVLKEFDDFAALLKMNGVEVIIHQDTLEPSTPDSIFPNNWISMHQSNTILLYPMFAENRRLERNKGIIELIQASYSIRSIKDYSAEEQKNRIVEGTGSLIFDHPNRLAYACRSARTDASLAQEITNELGYRLIIFDAVDASGFPIYHTNVMMCVTKESVIICLESIPENDRQRLVDEVNHSGKELVEITLDQMNHFAGNMLQLSSITGENILVMSTQAYLSLNAHQLESLEMHNKIVHANLDHIEKIGGGSARCMLAEVFLSK